MSATESTAVTAAVVEEVKQETTPAVVDTKTEEPATVAEVVPTAAVNPHFLSKLFSSFNIGDKKPKSPKKDKKKKEEVEAIATAEAPEEETPAEVRAEVPAEVVETVKETEFVAESATADGPAVVVKAATKFSKVARPRRLSDRVAEFFKTKPKTEVTTPSKVDDSVRQPEHTTPKAPKAEADADQSPMENGRTPPYTSNVTTAPSHTLPGLSGVSVRQPEYTIGVAGALEVATPNYIYYRIYAEDGAIPSKRPVAGDPFKFLGRIMAISVPPPRTLEAVKRSIEAVENIRHFNTTIFLTPYSQSPMSDAEKVTLLPGTTPQEPLALVATMSDSERSALESDGGSGLASAAEPDTEPDIALPEIQYLHYLLYGINHELPSKVAINSKVPFLGRIHADAIAPPRNLTSFKQCISRVERNSNFSWHADFFADTSSNTPLKESDISTPDGPGRSPNEPMTIILRSPIPDGKYLIRDRVNRDSLFRKGKNYYWQTPKYRDDVDFYLSTLENAKKLYMPWDITNDNNGNISIASPSSPYNPSSWVGKNTKMSEVPVPWRLIPADSKSYYYLTTDINCVSQDSLTAPTTQYYSSYSQNCAVLKEGNQYQMWEFIHI